MAFEASVVNVKPFGRKHTQTSRYYPWSCRRLGLQVDPKTGSQAKPGGGQAQR